MPAIEMVRCTSSGTEATMSALRVARAATKRDKVIKFAGCYHGHADSFLVEAGSGALTLGVPTSPGVSTAIAANTLTADYNDMRSVEALAEANPGQIAAVMVEPIAGNMGLVPPSRRFSRRPARDLRSSRHAADLRRSDLRLPRRHRRRAGRVQRRRPISPASARSSAAACRSAPTADAPT